MVDESASQSFSENPDPQEKPVLIFAIKEIRLKVEIARQSLGDLVVSSC